MIEHFIVLMGCDRRASRNYTAQARGGVDPLKAPEPLLILNPSNFVPKYGFPVVKGLISLLIPEERLVYLSFNPNFRVHQVLEPRALLYLPCYFFLHIKFTCIYFPASGQAVVTRVVPSSPRFLI